MSTAVDWAVRVRPRFVVVIVAWMAIGALFDYLDRELPRAVALSFGVVVVLFYLVPFVVEIGRSFAAGYRGREDPV